MKTCSKCGGIQAIEQFNNDRSRPDGKFPQCRECAKKDKKQYYEKHKESHMKGSAQWRLNHPERSREIQSRYRDAHRAKIAAKLKQDRLLDPQKFKDHYRRYYELHSDRVAERQRKERKDNPDRVKQRYQRYANANRNKLNRKSRDQYASDPEKHNKLVRDWGQRNPEKLLSYVHSRRARKKANGGTYTAVEWESLKKKFNNQCVCCGRDGIRLTVDHVNPISRGGSNSIENIQPMCMKCNKSKGTKTIDYREFWASRD